MKFPDNLIKEIMIAIEKALDAGAEPIAAFDADGTLWSTDMGESFFKYQIKNKLLENLPDDPWEFYVDFHKRDPEASYLWLAQVNQGKEIDLVRGWAQDTVKSHPHLGSFAGQMEIIQFLRKLNVEVYIVTASVKWAVEPAAALYGISSEKVLGIQTKIDNGIVTDLQEGVITYKQGKVKGLLEATGGRRPFYAAGNSPGDLPLLKSATHLRMVLNSAPEGTDLHTSEKEMLQIAKQNNWYYYCF